MEIYGSRRAVYDLLLDSGARFEDTNARPNSGEVSTLLGVPVIYDEAMPQHWVDMRDDGVLIRRLIQMRDGSWAAMDVEALRRQGMEVE